MSFQQNSHGKQTGLIIKVPGFFLDYLLSSTGKLLKMSKSKNKFLDLRFHNCSKSRFSNIKSRQLLKPFLYCSVFPKSCKSSWKKSLDFLQTTSWTFYWNVTNLFHHSVWEEFFVHMCVIQETVILVLNSPRILDHTQNDWECLKYVPREWKRNP